MSNEPKRSPPQSGTAPLKAIVPDPAPNDLGHEGFESNIKQNTTDQGRRKDRGD
jgi:hypothetical protein